nr:MAG TPA: hypothetical protein [Caudoviricetes sp.]
MLIYEASIGKLIMIAGTAQLWFGGFDSPTPLINVSHT